MSAALCRISFQCGTHLAFELRNYASVERGSKAYMSFKEAKQTHNLRAKIAKAKINVKSLQPTITIISVCERKR